MLREIPRVMQRPGEDRRRWFRDDYFDIFTWQDAAGSVTAFQLCYDLDHHERALSWRAPGKANGSYAHYRVDGGEGSPQANRSPILRPDGAFPWSRVMAELAARGSEIDPAIRTALRERIGAYPVADNAD